MTTITIARGDCLASIAHARGFDPDTIWNHPGNAELKELRHSPHTLLPGDRLEIPPREEREETVATGSVGRFKLSVGPVKLRLRLTKLGEARADEPFELLIDHQPLITGTTDGDGWIDEVIPPHAASATLTLRDGVERYVLKLGHLDPHDSPTGVQQRLRAIGCYFGAIDGEHSALTIAALRQFQTKAGLEANGEADESTLTALRDACGC